MIVYQFVFINLSINVTHVGMQQELSVTIPLNKNVF